MTNYMAELRNRETGRRAVVLGCGPSLALYDLDALRADGWLVVGTNQSCWWGRGKEWWPDYLLWLNDDVPPSIGLDVLKASPSKLVSLAAVMPPEIEEAGGITFQRTLPFPGAPEDDALFCGGSSAVAALALAWFLGCREVVLLGVDLAYAGGRRHFWDEKPCGENEHLGALNAMRAPMLAQIKEMTEAGIHVRVAPESTLEAETWEEAGRYRCEDRRGVAV